MLVKLTNDLMVNAAQIFSIRTRDVKMDDGTSYHLYIYHSCNANDFECVTLKSKAQRDILIQDLERALNAR